MSYKHSLDVIWYSVLNNSVHKTNGVHFFTCGAMAMLRMFQVLNILNFQIEMLQQCKKSVFMLLSVLVQQ